MAYVYQGAQPKTKTSNISQLNPPVDTQKTSSGASILPDAAQQHSYAKAAKNKTLRTLNAIKIVSPILETLISNPGPSADAAELSTAFKERVKTVSDLSAKTCLMLGIDPKEETNFWVRNVFEHFFSQITKNQWSKDNKLDTDTIEALIKTVLEQDEIVMSEYKAMNISVDSDVKIHLIKSVLPVVTQAQGGFSLNRDSVEDIEHVSAIILNAAKNNIDKIIDEHTEVKQRADLFKMLMIEAGHLYAACWKSYADFAQKQIDNMKPEEKEKLNKKYPKGLPLDKIDEEFHKYFERLLVVTQKLIPPKEGTIDNRMKIG